MMTENNEQKKPITESEQADIKRILKEAKYEANKQQFNDVMQILYLGNDL
jgi:hypothetical protein